MASDLLSGGARTFTDGDGRWRLDVPAADYAIAFEFVTGDNLATQWARQRVSAFGADVFTVNVGEEMIVDESLLPVGSISGRFTDHDGQPIVGGIVNISDVAGNFVANAIADDAGAYSFPVLLAAEYVMEFATPTSAASSTPAASPRESLPIRSPSSAARTRWSMSSS